MLQALPEPDWILNCSVRVTPSLAKGDAARWVWLPKQEDEEEEEEEEVCPSKMPKQDA